MDKVQQLYRVRDTLPSELIAIEKRLHDAGLHMTATKVNHAIQEIGYELAKKIEAAHSLYAGE